MNVEKLIYMANQIGAFFQAQGEAAAVAGIADHLAKFWDPRMRDAIYAHVDAGGEGLKPLVLQAVKNLKAAQSGA
jgi:formate dehydrogenase subunit delta